MQSRCRETDNITRYSTTNTDQINQFKLSAIAWRRGSGVDASNRVTGTDARAATMTEVETIVVRGRGRSWGGECSGAAGVGSGNRVCRVHSVRGRQDCGGRQDEHPRGDHSRSFRDWCPSSGDPEAKTKTMSASGLTIVKTDAIECASQPQGFRITANGMTSLSKVELGNVTKISGDEPGGKRSSC